MKTAIWLVLFGLVATLTVTVSGRYQDDPTLFAAQIAD